VKTGKSNREEYNFQPGDESSPGYLIDNGGKISLRESEYLYGWSEDNTEAARRRGKIKDPVKDTLVHFRPNITWEIALQNSDYEVTVCSGDSEFPSEDAYLEINGVVFLDHLKLNDNEFKEVKRIVEVRNNVLAMQSGENPHGPGVTRINFGSSGKCVDKLQKKDIAL
jgi:hypothetical protein